MPPRGLPKPGQPPHRFPRPGFEQVQEGGDVGSKATSSQQVKRDGQGDVPEIRGVKGSVQEFRNFSPVPSSISCTLWSNRAYSIGQALARRGRGGIIADYIFQSTPPASDLSGRNGWC
jgi:hypothetical protein